MRASSVCESCEMLIYLVDNTIDGQGESPRELRAVLGRLRPEAEILTERFGIVSLDRVRNLNPSHIILSGQSHPWGITPKHHFEASST